jgi:hypothetical protein
MFKFGRSCHIAARSLSTAPSAPRRSAVRLALSITAASVVAGALGVVGAAPADALPPDGGGGTPTATISGAVDLGGCVTTANNVHIRLLKGGDTYFGTVTPSGNNFTWLAEDLPGGTYTVRSSLSGGVCRFGRWLTDKVTTSVANGGTRTGIDFRYQMPSKITRVPGSSIAGAARVKAGDLAVRLHNLGPQHGASRLGNASSLTVAGRSFPFDVAEGFVDVDPCGLCPDAGDGRFYVNDLRSNLTKFDWLPTRGLQIALGFEEAGREIKGYYTPPFTNASIDSLMPDVQISGARLTTRVVPVVDGIGGIKLVPSGSPTFIGNMQATGPCDIAGFDPCDALFGYKNRIRDAATGGVNAALTNPTIQNLVRDQIRVVLNSFGIGTVTGVFLDGEDVVITE